MASFTMTTSESGVDFRHWYNFQLPLLSLNLLLVTSSFYFEYAAVDDDAISFVRTGEQEMEEEDEEVVNVEKNEEGDENENERGYEIEDDKKANEGDDENKYYENKNKNENEGVEKSNEGGDESGNLIVDIDWDLDTDTGIFLHRFFIPSSPLSLSLSPLKPIPKTFVILLDVSGGMMGTKWIVAKAAATHLLHQLHSDDLFTILPFTHKIDVPSFTSSQLTTW